MISNSLPLLNYPFKGCAQWRWKYFSSGGVGGGGGGEGTRDPCTFLDGHHRRTGPVSCRGGGEVSCPKYQFFSPLLARKSHDLLPEKWLFDRFCLSMWFTLAMIFFFLGGGHLGRNNVCVWGGGRRHVTPAHPRSYTTGYTLHFQDTCTQWHTTRILKQGDSRNVSRPVARILMEASILGHLPTKFGYNQMQGCNRYRILQVNFHILPHLTFDPRISRRPI